MQNAHSFVKALHGLRGVAVLYVFLSHIGIGRYYLVPFVHYDHIGKIGVVIFFSLSAFLLTGRLTDEFEARSSKLKTACTYFVHRFFRIYPLFVIVLVVHVLMGHFDWYVLLQHLLLQSGYVELWAIPVEFKFYFLIPLIALFSVRFGKAKAIIGLLAGSLCAVIYSFYDPNVVFNNDIQLYQKLEPFLLGAVLALAMRLKDGRGESLPIFSAKWIGTAAVISLAVSTYLFKHRGHDAIGELLNPVTMLIISVGTAGLIVAALQEGFLSRTLGSPMLVFFGEISFSMYLLHGFVLGLVWQHARDWHYTGAWLITFATILFSWISYSVVERPGMKLGYRIGRLIGDSAVG